MLERFFFTPEGKVRRRRMVGAIVGLICLAFFGGLLMLFGNLMDGHEELRTLWIIFSLFLLKFPLMFFIFWLLNRGRRWPGQRPKWDDNETREILRRLSTEAERALPLPDAPERLAHLQSEAWHVADRSQGALKGEAVDVAVSIGQFMNRPDGLRSRHGMNNPRD